jgi:hypothetical protein
VALARIGYGRDDARIITDQLIDNALCGYRFAGPRILAIAREAKTRDTRVPVAVVHETPVSALVDGGNNVGYVAVYRGAEMAIAKAKQTGIAAVGVYNSYSSGRNAYYLERVVNAGLVGLPPVAIAGCCPIATSCSSMTQVAPSAPNGRRRSPSSRSNSLSDAISSSSAGLAVAKHTQKRDLGPRITGNPGNLAEIGR